MKKGVLTIPKDYDPIFFCAVLREKITEWNYEKIFKEKDRKKGGKLRDSEIEQRILSLQDQYRNFTEEQKCRLFDFEFNIKADQIRTFSAGPPIFS